MMNITQVPKILEKIKNSQFYWVELPSNITMKYLKNIPFTVYIGESKLMAEILAWNEDEAYGKMYDYLNSVDDSDIMNN